MAASTLLTGISELWTLDPALDDPARPGEVTEDQVRKDAALVIEDGRIHHEVTVVQERPRDPADLSDLRTDLLEVLGVHEDQQRRTTTIRPHSQERAS